MVKFERKNTPKAQLAIEILEQEKNKKNGKYNKEEVNQALKEMFYDKCYICESKKVKSCSIEHFYPYANDRNLEFDWNNLFWSCSHCNNTKLGQYYPMLDCTKIDIDDYIAFHQVDCLSENQEFSFEIINDTLETRTTCELLNKVYYGITEQKRHESKIIREELRKDLSKFREFIMEYNEAEGEDKEDAACMIKMELKNNHAFTAFKRWIIRDNPKACADFIDCWKSR